MKETETQKNWNNFFENPHPPKKHNFLLPLIIIIAIAGAIIYYKYNVQKKGIEYNVSLNTNGILIEKHGISNQNGVDMRISIDSIRDILNNITQKNENELYADIEKIENMNLSYHYDEFKENIIQKIKYLIQYNKTKTRENVDLYNEINFIEELAKAFDKAGVTYHFTENGIEYQYYFD